MAALLLLPPHEERLGITPGSLVDDCEALGDQDGRIASLLEHDPRVGFEPSPCCERR